MAASSSIERAGHSVKEVIEIAQALQAAGVTTVFLLEGAPTRNGGKLRPSTLRRMLGNRFYAGWVEIGGEYIRARHEAIVSESVFSKYNS